MFTDILEYYFSLSDRFLHLSFSYLHYGLLAARAEILKISDDAENPCVISGYDGKYTPFCLPDAILMLSYILALFLTFHWSTRKKSFEFFLIFFFFLPYNSVK